MFYRPGMENFFNRLVSTIRRVLLDYRICESLRYKINLILKAFGPTSFEYFMKTNGFLFLCVEFTLYEPHSLYRESKIVEWPKK
jgi:hypothetical protein